MCEATYNGWNNWATWLVNLHYTNDQYSYGRLMELAEPVVEEYSDEYPDNDGFPAVAALEGEEQEFVDDLILGLGDKLREMVESDLEVMDIEGFFHDAVNSVIGDIDYKEWAENVLSGL